MRRTYKPALPHEKCVDMIAAAAGTQFDPVIVNAFLTVEADFAEIARRNSPAESTIDDDHVLAGIESDSLDGSLEDDAAEQVIPLSLLLSSLQRPAARIADTTAEVTAAALPASR